MIVKDHHSQIISYEVYPSFLAKKHSIGSHSLTSVIDSEKVSYNSGKLIIMLGVQYRDEQTKELLFKYEAREEVNFFLEDENKDKLDFGNLYVQICNKTFDFIANGPVKDFARCEIEEGSVDEQADSIIRNLKFNGFYKQE